MTASLDSTRVALVTGAAGGIGKQTVCCLKRDGWAVAATSLYATDDLLGLLDDRDMFHPADLTDAGAEDEITRMVSDRFGRLDGLVHCAGMSRLRRFEEQTDEDWDEVLSVNLSAAFRVARAVAPGIARYGNGGSIVMISSLAWKSGGANPAYGAAKAGVNTLVFNMAQCFGPRGVRVNAVAPGIIATDMVRKAFPGPRFEALEKAAGARTPLGRLGNPEDVAEVASFLLSDRSSFITGAVIPVTGGFELLQPIGEITG